MVLPSANIFFKISLFVVVFSYFFFRKYQKSVKQFGSSSFPSSLIWVQIVCKGYQQTTLVSKEFMTTNRVDENSESWIYIKLKEHQIFACLRYVADKLCQQPKPSSG